jgi:hypothetical protein
VTVPKASEAGPVGVVVVMKSGDSFKVPAGTPTSTNQRILGTKARIRRRPIKTAGRARIRRRPIKTAGRATVFSTRYRLCPDEPDERLRAAIRRGLMSPLHIMRCRHTCRRRIHLFY